MAKNKKLLKNLKHKLKKTRLIQDTKTVYLDIQKPDKYTKKHTPNNPKLIKLLANDTHFKDKIALSFGLVLLFSLTFASYFFNPFYNETKAKVPNVTLEELKAFDLEDPYTTYKYWERPNGPVKVGLQIGHYKINEVPEELEALKNNTGTSGGGKWEWEINKSIAELASKMLIDKGMVVDLLPATIPPDYIADVFVSIHADGNLNRNINGFKVSPPRRDLSQKANTLSRTIEEEYKKSTSLVIDPNITRNMSGYYAFNWRRYAHSIHPMTPSVILETGFLTSPLDQKLLINKPELAAKGLVDGILKYLQQEKLIKPSQ